MVMNGVANGDVNGLESGWMPAATAGVMVSPQIQIPEPISELPPAPVSVFNGGVIGSTQKVLGEEIGVPPSLSYTSEQGRFFDFGRRDMKPITMILIAVVLYYVFMK